jgi:small subunit ribosomal protein S16
MLSIRLSRVGKKRAPVYRIVVMPKHRDPWANNVEILGHYNPRKQPHELVLKADRVTYWLNQGAQPTDTVWNLLVDEKIVKGDKRGTSHISKKRAGKLDEKAAEAKEKEATAKAKAKEEKEEAEEKAVPAQESSTEKTPEAPIEEKSEADSTPKEVIKESSTE